MALKPSKIVTLITVGLLCFSAGAASGIMWMMFAGYKLSAPAIDPQSASTLTIPPTMLSPQSHLTKMNQLVSLIEKLDQLLGKPLTLELDERQRMLILAQLEGLDMNKPPTEEDTNIRINNILAAIENDRETLIAAGFRWPRNNEEAESRFFNPNLGLRSIEKLQSLRTKLAGKKMG